MDHNHSQPNGKLYVSWQCTFFFIYLNKLV